VAKGRGKRDKSQQKRQHEKTPKNKANKNKTIKNKANKNQVMTRTLRAGCQRTMVLETALTEIAYRALEYPECPSCPHRVEPEGATPFCVWRDENTPHPFAGLAELHAVLDVVDEAE
jgi:hypothetical protein